MSITETAGYFLLLSSRLNSPSEIKYGQQYVCLFQQVSSEEYVSRQNISRTGKQHEGGLRIQNLASPFRVKKYCHIAERRGILDLAKVKVEVRRVLSKPERRTRLIKTLRAIPAQSGTGLYYINDKAQGTQDRKMKQKTYPNLKTHCTTISAFMLIFCRVTN